MLEFRGKRNRKIVETSENIIISLSCVRICTYKKLESGRVRSSGQVRVGMFTTLISVLFIKVCVNILRKNKSFFILNVWNWCKKYQKCEIKKVETQNWFHTKIDEHQLLYCPGEIFWNNLKIIHGQAPTLIVIGR